MSQHNLVLDNYSVQELCALFDLSWPLTSAGLQEAKRKVLRTHPDKSRLPSEYFLFYRDAYTKLVDLYAVDNKTQQPVVSREYDAFQATPERPDTTFDHADDPSFARKFNQLFEEHMAKPKQDKNRWFREDEPTTWSSTKDMVVNANNINAVFDRMRLTTTPTNALTVHQEPSDTKYQSGASFYEEEEEGEGEGAEEAEGREGKQGQYVASNLFSKLPFDDLRRVHKDATIFPRCGPPKHTATSLETLQQQRTADERNRNLEPLGRAEAEALLRQKDQQFQQQMAEKAKRQAAHDQSYQSKNDRVLSYFLALQQG